MDYWYIFWISWFRTHWFNNLERQSKNDAFSWKNWAKKRSSNSQSSLFSRLLLWQRKIWRFKIWVGKMQKQIRMISWQFTASYHPYFNLYQILKVIPSKISSTIAQTNPAIHPKIHANHIFIFLLNNIAIKTNIALSETITE